MKEEFDINHFLYLQNNYGDIKHALMFVEVENALHMSDTGDGWMQKSWCISASLTVS